MAPADAGDFLLDEDDEDFFGEYNPHPYRGGYDLAATFGTPLPPSAKTCYPVSSSAAATVPTVPSPPSPTPEPADPPPEEPYGDEEAPWKPVHESSEVFPNGAATKGKGRRGRRRGRGFWKKCVRVLDYVFGYKDPYVEQRIGVDSYVVPVYANRKESEEDALAVEVEVPPPSVGRVEPHDGSEELVHGNDLSWHSTYKDDAYTTYMSNLYYTPSFAQSYGLPEVLGKPDWFPNLSYSESHPVEEFQHEHLSTYFGQSDGDTLETPAHAYNIQSYMPISDMPIEPFKPSWSQNWGLSDAYTPGDAPENDAHPLISGEYGSVGSLFFSPFYPRETEAFEWAPSDVHASFQHNWQNSTYQNVSMDGVSPISQQADDSYSMNGSFWPLGHHWAYSV
ncbi:uncharacterized protein At5g39570-like isoform X4 [Panicum virgatum]|uniref:uncharacterized protein At5g39570-like isoform X4 n=1 Tax=Panicum virgatum TaxID=38727 RepID=UPI0019D5EAC3|nr:uncharacterized protein At5g39570-like isoform X4 [Panicum virgatum]